MVPEEKSTSQKLATDAMFKLEHGEKDALKSKTAAPVIDRLQDHRERWRDDYRTNRILRDQFRVTGVLYILATVRNFLEKFRSDHVATFPYLFILGSKERPESESCHRCCSVVKSVFGHQAPSTIGG